MKTSIKMLNGKIINSIFKVEKEFINIKLILIEIIRINAFAKLLIKAPISPFFFALNEM
jgi:hypothetical protein